MVFDGLLGARDPEHRRTPPARRLLVASIRRAVESSARLRLADWATGNGPDGEQFSCVADLVAQELAADPVLAGRVSAAVRADDGALRSLRNLAARLESAGYDGAARECRLALQALAPAPGRPSLTSVTDRSRPA